MLFFVRVSWQFPARWSNCRQPFSLIMSLTPAPNCCFHYFAGWNKKERNMSQASRHFSLWVELHFPRCGGQSRRENLSTLPYVTPTPIFILMFHHSMASTCDCVCGRALTWLVGVVTFHTQRRLLSSEPERVFITAARQIGSKL